MTTDPTDAEKTVAVAKAMGMPVPYHRKYVLVSEGSGNRQWHPATSRDDCWLLVQHCLRDNTLRAHLLDDLLDDLGVVRGDEEDVYLTVLACLQMSTPGLFSACYDAMVEAGKIPKTDSSN